MRITVINFSGRSDGNCHNIAMVIRQAVSCSDEVMLVEMHDASISPCGKCEYGCFGHNESCPYIEDDILPIYKVVCSSDIAYYIVPNYCDYPNANFFIFNERGQCFFQNRTDLLMQYNRVEKKFIVVSNTEQDNFKRVFKYHIEENLEPEILFLAAKDFEKSSIKGDLMNSTKAAAAVEVFVRKRR